MSPLRSTRGRLAHGGRVAFVAVGLAALVLTSVPISPKASAQTSAPDSTLPPASAGEAGIVAGIPDASHPVDVSGRGYYSSLKIHINQTGQLVNQAISVSWSGCTATAPYASGCGPTYSHDDNDSATFSGQYNANYLQMFECWGPADGEVPADPGPSPTHCQAGGESNTASSYPISTPSNVYSRVLSQGGWADYSSMPGWVDPGTRWKIEPFVAVDGTVVNQQANYSNINEGFWQNPYYSFNTTNEVDFSRTYPDGTGSQSFQADTGLEAPGLGCGQSVEPQAGGSTTTPQCWLVIVPRSTPDIENVGTPVVDALADSPLTPSIWANRIAVPLQFNPVGTSCAIGAEERRIVGSELATLAVNSWQPRLCATPSDPPYNYTSIGDPQARTQLASAANGGPGMAVVSQPIDPSTIPSSAPVTYAPLTLSSVVIAFNIQRYPIPDADGQPEPSELPLAGTGVLHVNLTPRLVAKLLTESYSTQFYEMNPGHPPPAYSWIAHNPYTLLTDPDFLQYNPEFQLLSGQAHIDAGTLLVEQPSSDAANVLWQWVLLDRSARLWLEGIPDPWGMTVNPRYSTNADYNSSGVAFGSPTPSSYPKSDPYCYQSPATVSNQLVRPICFLDWSPYALTMQAVAQQTGQANDGAKNTANTSSPSPETYWASSGPEIQGQHLIMSITDSASAARYGLQIAALSRADDDTATPTFIAPSTAAVLAGEKAMVPSAVPGVLQPNPSTKVTGAYPLPMLTYAAVQPANLQPAAIKDYASFLQFGASTGQHPGNAFGDLPAGYIPLPASLQTQAKTAVKALLSAAAARTAPTTTTSITTATTVPEPTGSTAPVAQQSAIPPTAVPSTAAPAATTVPLKTTAPPSTGHAAKGSSTTTGAPQRTALATLRTPATAAPALRWILPIALGVGVAAIFIGRLTGQRRRIKRG